MKSSYLTCFAGHFSSWKKLAVLLALCLIFAPASLAEPAAPIAPSLAEAPLLSHCSALMKARRYDDCIAALYNRLSAKSCKELWDCLGTAYYKVGDLRQAKEAYKAGLSADQNYWCFWEGLSRVYYDEGRLDESMQLHAKAYKLKKLSEIAVESPSKKQRKSAKVPAGPVEAAPTVATVFESWEAEPGARRVTQRENNTSAAPRTAKWRVTSDLPVENQTAQSRPSDPY